MQTDEKRHLPIRLTAIACAWILYALVIDSESPMMCWCPIKERNENMSSLESFHQEQVQISIL